MIHELKHHALISATPVVLQMKKIRREVEARGGTVASAPAPASAAPAPAAFPVAPAPAAAAVPNQQNTAAGAPAGPNAELAQLQERAALVTRSTQQYAAAQGYLTKAEADCKSAIGSLKVTQFSGATETLQDVRLGMGPGGRRRGMGRGLDRRNDFAHNMIEMATINKASARMKDAAQQIMAAKQQLPNLPYIQMGNVQQAMGGVFFNALLAPGLFGDMMQNAKVRKAKDSANQMHQEVVQALQWCVNNMNAAQMEAAQLNSRISQLMAGGA